MAFIPKTAASPGVPLGPALQGANPNPTSLVVKKDTLLNTPRVLLESWHGWFLITRAESGAKVLPPQHLGELLPYVRGNNVFICELIHSLNKY